MRRFWLLASLLVALSGCAALPSILAGIGQGAQWLGSLVDVAEAGSDAYFARHPSQARAEQVDQRVRQAKMAVAALNQALAAAQAAESKDVQTAKQEAVTAYERLRELLDELGVLGAVAPPGGAETDAPAPEPLELPSAEDVASLL